MGGAEALRLALELLHVPSRARLVKSQPLPSGVLLLLQIAADDRTAIDRAIELSGRSEPIVRDAAHFFIEQLLWYPGADSYRALGATRDATNSELKRNMALLMVWLHPDQDRRDERSVFVHRVTNAWNNLKTPERRAAYDRSNGHLKSGKVGRKRNGYRGTASIQGRHFTPIHRWDGIGQAHNVEARPGFWARAFRFILRPNKP
jgi:hypothetical protein